LSADGHVLTFRSRLWISIVAAVVATVCAVPVYPRSWPVVALISAGLLALNWVTAVHLVGTDVTREGVLIRKLVRRRWIPAEDIVRVRARGRLLGTVVTELSSGDVVGLPCVVPGDVPRIRDALFLPLG
jgi:hypothetical protein